MATLAGSSYVVSRWAALVVRGSVVGEGLGIDRGRSLFTSFPAALAGKVVLGGDGTAVGGHGL